MALVRAEVEQEISGLYLTTLGRAADSEGLEYWVAELDREAFSKDRFIEAINNGATEDDAVRLENMKEVGYYYTKEVGFKNDLAKQVLASVDATGDSKSDALSLIDFYEEKVDALSTASGQSEETLYENIADDSYLESLGVPSTLLDFASSDNGFWENGDEDFLDNATLWGENSAGYEAFITKSLKNFDIDAVYGALDEETLEQIEDLKDLEDVEVIEIPKITEEESVVVQNGFKAGLYAGNYVSSGDTGDIAVNITEEGAMKGAFVSSDLSEAATLYGQVDMEDNSYTLDVSGFDIEITGEFLTPMSLNGSFPNGQVSLKLIGTNDTSAESYFEATLG